MKIVNAYLAATNNLQKCAWRIKGKFASPFLPEAILTIPTVYIAECFERRRDEIWE
jgi:hypothetical protein